MFQVAQQNSQKRFFFVLAGKSRPNLVQHLIYRTNYADTVGTLVEAYQDSGYLLLYSKQVRAHQESHPRMWFPIQSQVTGAYVGETGIRMPVFRTVA